MKEQNIRANGVVVTKYPQVGNGIDFVELSHEDSPRCAEGASLCLSRVRFTDSSGIDGDRAFPITYPFVHRATYSR